MSITGRWRSARPIGLALLLAPSAASAAEPAALISRAQTEVVNVGRESSSVQAAVDRARGQRMSVAQRLANGEMLFRSRDYSRAVVVLSEILEEYPNTPAYPDALWLRGETFYAEREYLSARRDYRALVAKATDPRFEPYFGRALARLVDVSLRVGDVQGLDEVFARLNQVPPAQVDAGLNYAKGKAYFARADYSMAQQSFAAVPSGTAYTHQARYFQALVTLKTTPPGRPASADGSQRALPANYKQAVEAFRVVTKLPADTEEHQHVVDLAWMAIGRLFYEMESYTQAAESYGRVARTSPEFGTMLYELAWVYVRLGDVQRAERALEVLQIADPGSPLLADGTLLRADLLLRAGSFDKALQLYSSVRGEYEPHRAKVDAFIEQNPEPSVYYDKLAQQQLDLLDQNDQLPPVTLRWAREAEDGPLAFAVIDDVNQCKQLIRQSYTLIEKLNAILSASNRVRAFPELAAGEEKALALLNRLSRARLDLVTVLDKEEPDTLGGEMAQVRADRRALMASIAGLPASQADFAQRDYVGEKQWNGVSQELSRRTVEVDYLHATINGLRRMLREDAQRGVARDPESVRRFSDELDANERELRERQSQIETLRRHIDVGRAQIGIGDARYQADATARSRFRDVVEREAQLAATGQAGVDAQRMAATIQPTLRTMRRLEDDLATSFAKLERQVAERIGAVKAKVQAERLKIDDYNVQLGALDGEARTLVGEVAKRNFGIVQQKLRNIVLRADVGITEQAWEVREEELYRVHNLQTERSRQETLLDEELREVLDDSGDSKP